MKQFDHTTLFNLSAGDRFYVIGDRTKKVYQVNSVEHKKTKFVTYVQTMGARSKDVSRRIITSKTDKNVIYLSNVNQVQATSSDLQNVSEDLKE